MDYKQKIVDYLAEHLPVEKSFLEKNLETPPKEEMGDYALPCFQLAKELRKAPQMIAGEFSSTLEDLPSFMERIENLGPYVNIFLDKASFCKEYLESLQDEMKTYPENEGKTICIDFSAPNIAKPFHVGHAFSTFLGDVIARMYEAKSYQVERINHLGDYGTQFGKLIVAYENWGDEKALEEDPIKELLRIYVLFHKEAEEHPELEDEARKRFRALESGEEKEYQLWEAFRALSLEEFNRIYAMLDVKFTSYRGESFYSDYIPALVKELEEKKLLVDSEGAKIVLLEEENLPPCLVLKSDGSTIYATRDLAAAKFRYDEYQFEKNIYVVGLPQSLHFQQVFAVLKKAGFAWADNCSHVGFGLVKFPGDVLFSTRSGDVVYLEDLLNESIQKTKGIIIANNETREEKMSEEDVENTAKAIGLAAIRYTFLRNSREKDIIFRWEDILDFDGDSAPYMQYAYARAKSILRKSDVSEEDIQNYSLDALGSDSEFQLVRLMAALDEQLELAMKNSEPSIYARQIMTMCRAFSRFYNQMPILQGASDEEKKARLRLCYSFQKVLRESLAILGIQTVERM